YAKADMAVMVGGIELTLKSMLDGVRKFGVEVIAETNVPLDPNVRQAIAMVESEEVAAGSVLGIMQKGYTLNGRTMRAAMVTVA
ncbi:nucleotide exchange factor GrpE, partial [Salmonella enterica]|uniref:nucleotide exchange factor GrpE n=1 Tax=Salmonella enterica TaxID=28901 RepID=UPI00083B7526